MAERNTQLDSFDLSGLESQFDDVRQTHQEQLRAYVNFLGLVGDKPRFLTTTTPGSEWLMLVERSQLGNPYHERVRAVETRYDKLSRTRTARDMLIDLTDLKMAILDVPIFRYPEFLAERAPDLSFAVESDTTVWLCEGRKYQSMYAGHLAKMLAEKPADGFEAVAVLGKYAKGSALDVVGQEAHYGINDELQARSLNLAA
jgi:hypothetical protein